MTPLAHRIVKQLTLPPRDRSLKLEAIRDLTEDVHCFEISEVLPVIEAMDAVNASWKLSGKDFLPAPRTWLEWIDPRNGRRVSILLDETASQHEYYMVAEADPFCVMHGTYIKGDLNYLIARDEVEGYDHVDERTISDSLVSMFSVARVALAIINTPRLIGRVTRTPHRGLERALQQQYRAVGKYPLHAWHEIKLEAFPRYTDETGEEVEAHLTGRKCLHFCRAHLRIRNGRLEMVSSHWRGDPALGIKRSRYKIAA
jgi:hypothetical protein